MNKYKTSFEQKGFKTTKCCGFVYNCEKHNPIREDGYCLNCGHHPELHKLQVEVKELRKMVNFYEHKERW